MLKNLIHRFASWLARKTMPAALTGPQWGGTSFVDAFKKNRNPTPHELQAELKSTAWACASLNASTCAAFPPRLYVSTNDRQPNPKCQTAPVPKQAEARIRSAKHLHPRNTKAQKIEEVLDHPLISLLQQVNPIHNSFDLWELTQLYLEVHGRAFWYLDCEGPFNIPTEIWLLPTQNVTPKRNPGSNNPVDFYEYRTGHTAKDFAPEEIIFFRFPDPRDPYTGGLSPLRACFEQISLLSEFTATKSAIYDNRAIPSAVVSPDEVIGEEERDRLENQWNAKFRKGGSGRVVVAESGLKVQLLQQSLGDLAALADIKATKDDVCNAFHVPTAFFTSSTNLANLQASNTQHRAQAVAPRLQRRDEKLNEQLIPLFDQSGRLFLASEDPVPDNADHSLKQMDSDLKWGTKSINQVRSERGLEPVAWGNVPWLPLHWAPTDFLPRVNETIPRFGRNDPSLVEE